MSTTVQPDDLRIELPLPAIADFCRRWKIVRLEVFGSALRPAYKPDSDVDFLYTFAGEARLGFKFMNAWDELEGIVGRAVDLVSRKAVERSKNPPRQREILKTAKVGYEA